LTVVTRYAIASYLYVQAEQIENAQKKTAQGEQGSLKPSSVNIYDATLGSSYLPNAVPREFKLSLLIKPSVGSVVNIDSQPRKIRTLCPNLIRYAFRDDCTISPVTAPPRR